MPGLASRAKPYPYTLHINGVGVRTRGDIIGRKVQSLSGTVPNADEYGQDDVYREKSYVFGRTYLGMGEAVQRSTEATAHRYRYALNCWFSAGRRGKGPKWNPLAPTNVGAISDFVEALHGGNVVQFILAGRYLLRRTDDTSAGQTLVHDFGAGRTITGAVRFQPAGGTDSLYVTLDNGDLHNYNGATMSAAAAAAGTWSGDAFLIAVVSDDIYIKDTPNTVRRTTGDPMVGTNYSGAFGANDAATAEASRTITGLGVLNNALFAFMDNGTVVTFNSDGTPNDIAVGLRTTPAATNGSKPVADTQGYLYFRNGGSWFRMQGLDGGSIQPIGPERLADNDSEVTGVAQVFTWYGAYYGFWGIYNTLNGASYLLQFGDWIPRDDEDGITFVETFNGALVKWAGKQISAMRVQFIAGVPRLYCGFTDGTYGWIKLPSNTHNPFSPQSGAEFANGENGASVCRWPRHTMRKEADDKAYLHFQAFGPVLSPTNHLQVSYRTDTTGTLIPLDQGLTRNGQREDFQGDVIGTLIDIEETFVSTSSASTPVIESLILREQLRPSMRIERFFTINARHRVALRNGSTDPKTPDQIVALCVAASNDPGSTVLTLPDELVGDFHAVNYEEHIPADVPARNRYGLARDIAMSFVQYRTAGIYGTVDRLGELTVDDLGSLTVDDLGTL